MINLFEEFYYDEKEGLCLAPHNAKKDFYFKDDFNELLQEKLEEGKLKRSLINLRGVRAIGKTRALVNFAKKYNYTVVTQINSQAEYIKKEFKYEKVISQSRFLYRVIEDKLVLDETVLLSDMKKFKSQIITGYVRNSDKHTLGSFFEEGNKKELEDVNNEDILNILNNEIRQLSDKITQARNTNNFGTYKNLIQAFANILEIKDKYEKDDRIKGIIMNKIPIEISIQDMEEFSNALNKTLSNYLAFTIPKN